MQISIIIMIDLPGLSTKRRGKSIIPIIEDSIIIMMGRLGLSAKRRGESIHSNYRGLHNYYDGSSRAFWEEIWESIIIIIEDSISIMMGRPGLSGKRS